MDDPNRMEVEKNHLVQFQEFFVFREYLCVVFELLEKSLFDIVS